MTARILLMFVVLNLALFAVTGVRSGGDTGIYVDGARGWLAGQPLSARQPSYAGYIAVVTIFEALGAGLVGVVLFQIAVAAAAAVVVYRFGIELGGASAGMAAATMFALDLNTNRWHMFILTDSLYLSMLVIAAWLVHRAASAPRQAPSPKPQAPSLKPQAALALLAAALIRPEGWFVMPAAAAYWVVRRAATSSRRWAGLATVLAATVLMVLLVGPRLSGNVEAVGPAQMLRQGETIWEYTGWRVAMPVEPASADNAKGAAAAIGYALRHPVATLTLMLTRVGVHVAHVRPYYSRAHNLAIVAWLLPIYALAAYGAWILRRHVLTRWCAVVIATQTLVVALTHADWDGRYLAHVLPLVYPFAGCGVALLAAQWWPPTSGVAVAR